MKRLLPLLLTLLLALTPIARAETMTFSDMTIPAYLVSVEVTEDGYGMTLHLTMTPPPPPATAFPGGASTATATTGAP